MLFFFFFDICGQNDPFLQTRTDNDQPFVYHGFEYSLGASQDERYTPFKERENSNLQGPVLRGPDEEGTPIGGLPVGNGLWILSFFVIAYCIIKIIIKKKDKKHFPDRYLLSLMFCCCVTHPATAQYSSLYGMWAKKTGFSGSEGWSKSRDVFTDEQGNVYVVGVFSGTVNFSDDICNPNYASIRLGTDKGSFLTKFDADGKYQWKVYFYCETGDDLKIVATAVPGQNRIALVTNTLAIFNGSCPNALYAKSPVSTSDVVLTQSCSGQGIDCTTDNYIGNSGFFYINTDNGEIENYYQDICLTESNVLRIAPNGNIMRTYFRWIMRGQTYTTGRNSYMLEHDASTGDRISGANGLFGSGYPAFVYNGSYGNYDFTNYNSTEVQEYAENGVQFLVFYREETAGNPSRFTGFLTKTNATFQQYYTPKLINADNSDTPVPLLTSDRYDPTNATTTPNLYAAFNVTHYNNTISNLAESGKNFSSAEGCRKAVIMKMDRNLNHIWSFQLGENSITSTSESQITSIKHYDNYIYVTGCFTGAINFNPVNVYDAQVRTADVEDGFYAVYDLNGYLRRIIVFKGIGGPGNDAIEAMSITENGSRILLAGRYNTTNIQLDPQGYNFTNPLLYPLTGDGGISQTFVSKYCTSACIPTAFETSYGDAPVNYGVAAHYIYSCLYLGDAFNSSYFQTAPDPSMSANTALNDNGLEITTSNGYTDLNGNGSVSGPDFKLIDDNLVATVRVHNNSSLTSEANLIGWIDFNRDGVFDVDEASPVVEIPRLALVNTYQLIWLNAKNRIQGGVTYLRLRLTSDPISASESTGLQFSGEVEDYYLNFLVEGPDYYSCLNEEVIMTMPTIENVAYNWYDSPSGGNLLAAGMNTYAITKNNTDAVEYFWVERVLPTGPESYRYRISVKLVPDLMFWKKTATNNNWNDPLNWVDVNDNLLNAVPLVCTDVHIPGNADNYPSLDEINTPRDTYGAPVCNDITYHFGGEVAKPHYLTYHRAYIQYNFGYYETDKSGGAIINGDFSHSATPMNRDRWYALAAPLKKIVTGDFSVGGFPSMWQRGFRTSPDRTSDLVGEWYIPENTMALEIGARQNYAISIYAACYTAGLLGENDHANLNGLKGIFEFPYFENPEVKDWYRLHEYDSDNHFSRLYYYYYQVGGLPIEYGRYDDFPRGEEAYRFILEDGNNSPQADFKIKVLITDKNDDGEPDDIMIGNPFISSLDFDRFYALNSSKMENYYRLYTVGNFETYTSELRPLIASMQAFFIKPQGAVGSEIEFSFTEDMSVLRNFDYQLKSTKRSEIGNMLKISAENNDGSSWILLAPDSEQKNDIVRLFSKDLRNTPQIYSYGANLNKNTIQYVGEDEQISLGIRTESNRQFKLIFDNIENFPAESLWLYDKELKREYNLSDNNVYPFENASENLSDRFVLSMKKIPTGIEPVTDSKTNIYLEDKELHVDSDDILKRIQIFNIQGLTVFLETEMNTHSFTKEMDIPSGVYIVVLRLSTGEPVTGKIFIR